jgi:hypothetical protein
MLRTHDMMAMRTRPETPSIKMNNEYQPLATASSTWLFMQLNKCPMI